MLITHCKTSFALYTVKRTVVVYRCTLSLRCVITHAHNCSIEILQIVEIEETYIWNDGRQMYILLGRAEASRSEPPTSDVNRDFSVYIYLYMYIFAIRHSVYTFLLFQRSVIFQYFQYYN